MTEKTERIRQLKIDLIKALAAKDKARDKEIRKEIEDLDKEDWFCDQKTGEKLWRKNGTGFLEFLKKASMIKIQNHGHSKG